MTSKITAHSQLKAMMCSKTDQILLDSDIQLHWIFHTHNACLCYSIHAPHSTITLKYHYKNKILTQTQPYLQQTGPAETARSTQTAETSFWLPGAFHSSPPAIYTAPLKVRGHASGGGDWKLQPCQPLCVGAAAWPCQEC